MSDPDALRLAGWHLALFIGDEGEQEMWWSNNDLRHMPDLMEASAYALERADALRDNDLLCIARLRKRVDVAESERDAGARALVATLSRCDALHRQLADERTVHHATASAGQVEMLHAELSVAPRLALVRAGDAMALARTPETVAGWESARDGISGIPHPKGVAAFFGTWPGDESEAELLASLDDVRGKDRSGVECDE